MQIALGALAPALSTDDIYGKRVDLAQYRGRMVLVSFFRNAACALCNLRVHTLIQQYERYQRAGMEIVAVFESHPAAMRAYVGRQDAPFALIADPEAQLYDLYGVESSQEKVEATMASAITEQIVMQAASHGFALTHEPDSNFLRMPADFLIDADGRILIAHYSAYVWDHLPLETIDAVLGIAAPIESSSH